ncbi:MAG: TonB family protein [Cyanobacteria bacterium P01_G01_bin.49]
MSLSTFCNKYRNQSQKALKTFTIYGFVFSALLHLLSGIGFSWLSDKNAKKNASETVPKPIELQFVEPPEPDVAKVEPEQIIKPEPQPTTPSPSEQVQEARLSSKQILPAPSQQPVSPQPKTIPNPSTPAPRPIPLASSGSQSLEKTLTGTQGSGSVAGNQGTSKGEEEGSKLGTEGAKNATNATGTGDSSNTEASWLSLKCISACQPQYPSSLEKKVPGRVIVQFKVETDGSVSIPQVAETSGNSDLDKAAVQAVSQMKFSPPDDGLSRKAKLPITYTVPN